VLQTGEIVLHDTAGNPAFLKNHVREGVALGGKRRFFLANGCSIDTWVNPAAGRAVVAASRGK
jgi:hypothetical protein